MTINTWNCLHFTSISELHSLAFHTSSIKLAKGTPPLIRPQAGLKQTISLYNWTVMQKNSLFWFIVDLPIVKPAIPFFVETCSLCPRVCNCLSRYILNYSRWLLIHWPATQTCLCDTSQSSPKFTTQRLVRVQINARSTMEAVRNSEATGTVSLVRKSRGRIEHIDGDRSRG